MKRSSVKKKKISEAITGWLFIAPLCIGMLLFLAFPLVYAIVISFTSFNGFDQSTFKFVGFDNFVRVFNDSEFWYGMRNVMLSCLGVPIGVALALILTNILVSNPKCSIVFKSIYYVPTICGAVAITFIWKWLYFPSDNGLINSILTTLFGCKPITFISRENFIPSMMVMGIWSGMGVSVLLIYASLKGVNKQLFEAASIDGANFLQKFWYITIPAVSPTLFYILITGISGNMQEYARFSIMGGNNALDWNVTPVWAIVGYVQGSGGKPFEAAYACSMGLVLGVFILIVSAIQFVVSKYWVNYDS
ncbi:MAG: sugar ABC transporter permease [Bacilli bacterium]|nr:sugar ABC transporter permease [Bacilli bacterium]